MKQSKLLTPKPMGAVPWDHVMVMAATIWGEARGETYKGKVAVAWVIRNRAESPTWWGSDIESVCLKPYQFSCWNSGDPNVKKVRQIGLEWDGSIKAVNETVVQECVAAALAVIRGKEPDDTDGSTHYHTVAIEPDWAKGKVGTRLGNHLFYNDVE